MRSWHLARFSIADSFAETINAFCGYDDADVKSKILVRIHSILVLENRLVDYMKICAFDPATICPQFTPKAGMASIVHDKKKSKPLTDTDCVQAIRPYFRDLELRTISAVCYSDQLVCESAFKPKPYEIIGITPSMMLFLIANFRCKVDFFFSLSTKATANSAVGETSDTDLPQLFDSFKDIFPHISLHLQNALSVVFEGDSISRDPDIGTSSASIAVEILGIFNKLVYFAANHPISWLSNLRYLLACLACNVEWQSLWPLSFTIDVIIEQCISVFASFSSKFGLDCVVSAAIVETLNHIASTQHNSEQSQRVSNLAMQLLAIDWNAPAKQKHILLPCIVRHAVRLSSDPAVPLRTFTDALLELSETTSRSGEVQAVSHSTMSIFFQCCIEEQVSHVLRLSCCEEGSCNLDGILKSITAFGDLCHLSKIWETNKRIHKICLLFSSKYMDKLLKIMPQLSKRFASDRDQIVEILQKMQKGTRILQILCLHCKSTKDPTLINAIPSLKKNLERVIFNVKSILEAHRCLKAFWVGNLKTKNLRGEEISSQVNNPRCNVILPTFHDTVYPSVRRANCQRRQRRCFWSR